MASNNNVDDFDGIGGDEETSDATGILIALRQAFREEPDVPSAVTEEDLAILLIQSKLQRCLGRPRRIGLS